MSGLEPKVEIEGETPTQKVVKDANRVEMGTDGRGRKIGVKRFSMSARRRMMKVLTAESGAKPGYVGLAAVASCCVSIDGEMIPFPDTEMKIDALIDRLDDDGMECVSKLISENFTTEATDLKN